MGEAISETGLETLYRIHCEPIVAKAIVKFADSVRSIETLARYGQDDSAEKILSKRYYLKDLDGNPFEDRFLLFCRVALAPYVGLFHEDWDASFPTDAVDSFTAMWEGKFLPNSPTIMNACTRKGQLSACFVVPVEDDIDSIYGGVNSVAKIHKSGGGTGMSFSKLRQKDAKVKTTGGVASGPVSFMRVYDVGTDVIKQGGKRRGANMGMLRIDHPDLMEFISCKDEGDLQNFNLSVAITNEFMQALKGNGPNLPGFESFSFALRDPRTGEDVLWVDAREVWRKLAEHAWISGDPGVVFIDRINETQPFDIKKHPEHTIEATNPCWTGDTKVWTLYGPKTFAELAATGDDVPVLTKLADGRPAFRVMHAPRKTRENVEVVELVVRAHCSSTRGHPAYASFWERVDVLRCTPDHNVILSDGRKVMVKDLQPGDSIASIYRGKANQKGYISLSYGMGTRVMEHHVVAEFKYGHPVDYPREHAHHIDENKANNHPDNIEVMAAHAHNSMNKGHENNPNWGVWDERNPLYGRDFSGENNPRWKGVPTKEIVALREQGLGYGAIAKKVGLAKKTVYDRLKKLKPQPVLNHTVVEVRPCGNADVYNGTVDETHSYFVMCGDNDAILSANCGEQPLEGWEACNLGSINLSKFFKIDSSGEEGRGTVDHDELRRITRLAVRYLDGIIDASVFPLPAITDKVRSNRKIGLGVMGWADLLISMGVRYGSSDSLAIAEALMSFIAEEASHESEDLAELYGVYPNFAESIDGEIEPPFLQRNATLTTIAPTGTLSMIAGCSSGIEPVFALAFTKTVMDGEQFQYTHPGLKVINLTQAEINALEISGHLDTETLKHFPWLVTAYQVKPAEHIKMQAAFQKFVDNAVSKTVNLPADATVDDIEAIYTLAYDTDCKGVTIYRDGSKEGQVLTVGTESKEAPEPFAQTASECDTCPLTEPAKPMPRPETMIGVTSQIETPCGTMYVVLNVDDDGDLREVFCILGKSGVCGRVVCDTAGRMASISLRAGMSVDSIIKQLAGQSCGSKVGFGERAVTSCVDALSKKLVAFRDGGILGFLHSEIGDLELPIALPADETLPAEIAAAPVATRTNGACPECGSRMVHDSGCKHCISCGHSECA